MKVYISVDIEGITGVSHWDDTSRTEKFAEQMTREASAACVGACEAGAIEILVKDAHGSGRNINGRDLPLKARLHSNWDMGPLSMMDGLDETFDAVVFVGYHSGAQVDGNPLAHTFSHSKIQYLKMNGNFMSEFELNTMIAHYFGVPVVFISGDHALCQLAMDKYPHIKTEATMVGKGDASISIHPDLAIERISAKVEESLKRDLGQLKKVLPEKFSFEISFKEAKLAYRAAYYPGVTRIDAKTVTYETHDFMEYLKMFMFIKV